MAIFTPTAMEWNLNNGMSFQRKILLVHSFIQSVLGEIIRDKNSEKKQKGNYGQRVEQTISLHGAENVSIL